MTVALTPMAVKTLGLRKFKLGPIQLDAIAQHCNEGRESAMNSNGAYARPRILIQHHNM
jgi:hypothetical protein